jgi:hypothetical protein
MHLIVQRKKTMILFCPIMAILDVGLDWNEIKDSFKGHPFMLIFQTIKNTIMVYGGHI